MLLDAGNVLATLVDILTALQEDGAEAEFDQMQSRKESGRPRADHDHAGRTGNIAVADRFKSHGGFVFINKEQHREIDENPTLACVDAFAQKAHSADGTGRKVEFGGTMAAQSFFLQSYIGREAKLDFFLHTGKRELWGE